MPAVGRMGLQAPQLCPSGPPSTAPPGPPCFAVGEHSVPRAACRILPFIKKKNKKFSAAFRKVPNWDRATLKRNQRHLTRPRSHPAQDAVAVTPSFTAIFLSALYDGTDGNSNTIFAGN